MRLNSNARKLDTVFLVFLFTLFAVTSFLLVFIGAKQYRITADAMDENYELRTAASYLREKLHQHDADNDISVTVLSGADALALGTQADGRTYTTYIYYWDGALRELFVGEDAVYTPESGQEIIELNGFSAELVHTGLIRVTLTDTNGQEHSLFLDMKAASGKENP